MYKTYSFSADPVVRNSYKKELADFKKQYLSSESKGNLTLNRTQYIVDNFEQPWLLSAKSVKIDNSLLDSMLTEVKQARNTFMELAFSGSIPEM